MKPTRPAALVLDAQTRQGLAACRALGRGGFTVAAAAADADALSRASRHVTRFHRLDGTVDAAARLVREHGYDVVVASEDPTVAALQAAPPGVPTVPVLGDEMLRLANKVALAETARAAGVAYPETVPLGAGPAPAGLVELLGTPVVVKAIRSAELLDSGLEHRSGARMAYTPEEIEQAASWIRGVGLEPVAQRYAERSDKIDVALVRHGRSSEVRLPYRVLRDVPLTGGIAVTLETLRADAGIGAEALDAAERLIDVAGYEGIANVEFCVAADGTLTLIEVNTRLWASLWFAERLGQRVTERCVRHVLGLPALTPAPLVRAGRRYHNLAGEVSWIRRHPRRLQPARAVLRRLRPWDVFDYLDLTDPLPPLRLAASKVGRRARRRQ